MGGPKDFEAIQQRVQLDQDMHEFERLVDALTGLSDAQVSTLMLHGANIVKPEEERDKDLETKFYDAWQAAQARSRRT